MVIMISLRSPASPSRLMLLAILAWPKTAIPADLSITPTLRLRESYTDNMNLAPQARARSELINEVAPGVTLASNTPGLQLALSYTLQKVSYTHQADRTSQELDAHAHADVLPDWLFLDTRSSINRYNASAFGPQLSSNLQAIDNARTVHNTSIAPYLKHYFSGLASALLRYDYQHVGSGGLLDVRSNGALLQLVGDTRARDWNWTLTASHRQINDAALAPVTMNNAAMTLSYPVDSSLAAFGTAGCESSDYHAIGSQPQGRYWSAGVTWMPSPRTRVSASMGRRYFGRTHSLDASYRMRRMLWTLNYGEDITTTHGEFLSIPPASIADFLDALWAERIPDPQTRRQTIQVFLAISQAMGQTGNVNFFSHRYYLQKQWQMASVYSAQRSTLAFNFADVRRTAQSSNAIDSLLLGPDELSLTDDTRQQALQIGWNWRLSSRGNLTASASRNRAQSLSTGRLDRNSRLTLSLTHQLSSRISANADIRHAQHTSNRGGNFRENGAGISLLMAF